MILFGLQFIFVVIYYFFFPHFFVVTIEKNAMNFAQQIKTAKLDILKQRAAHE